MAWWDGGLLGGGGGSELDIYGDLFSKEQKAALQQRQAGEGLLKLAGAFGAAAQPSRVPTSFLGSLGQAAGAMAGSGDEATKTALEAMKTGEAVRASKQKRDLIAKATPIVQALIAAGIDPNSPVGRQALAAAGVPANATPAAPPGAAAAPVAPPPGAPQMPGAPAPPDLADIAGPASWAPPGLDPGAGAPLSPGAPAPPRVTGKGVMPPGGLITPDDYNRYLGITPAAAAPAPGQPQQNAGLLPPQDQMVGPDGQPLTGQGILPTMNASYGGAPGGMPPFARVSATSGPSGPTRGAVGDDEWLRQNAPFPVQGRGRGPSPQYTNELPKVPFGQDPGDFLPGRGASPGTAVAAASPPTGTRYSFAQLKQLALDAGFQGRDADTAAATWMGESGGNPFARNVTDKEASFGIAQINARAHPGGEQAYGNPQYSARKAFELYQADKARGGSGFRDWTVYNTGAYKKHLGEGGTRMAAAPDLSNMAGDAGGGGDDAAPGATGGGYIPGLGITPQGLGALNALLEMGGVDSPFKSVLETYYKSPGYLGEAETAKEKAKIAEQEPFQKRQKMLDFHLKMRGDGFLIDDKGQVVEDPSYVAATGKRAERSEELKLKYQKQQKTFEEQITIEQEKRADQRQVVTTPVYGPDGRIVQQEMLQADRLKKLRDQTMRPGEYKPGDIVAKPIGDPPAGHEWRMTPQGELKAEPVAGTPAAREQQETVNKQLQTEHQKLIARDVVVREVDNIGKLMESATLPTTGFAGSILQNLGGTAANDVRVARQTLEARLSTDAINAMRAASPTGAALGNTTDTDMAILRTALVNLDQSQNKDQFKERLQILKQAYVDAVHGPGASRLLPDKPVLKSPEPPSAREWKSGDIVDYPDGSQRQLKGEEWVITKPPRK